MKWYSVSLISILLFLGCSNSQYVDFVFFNRSNHDIRVEKITGMSVDPPVGLLTPVDNDSEDNGLQTVGSSFSEAVHITDRIKIVWQEGGTSHEVELKRDDLGLPAKLMDGKVRFTYSGNDKWRVTRLK